MLVKYADFIGETKDIAVGRTDGLILITRGCVESNDSTRTHEVETLYKLVSKRRRLSHLGTSKTGTTREDWWQALEDLYTLCTQDFTEFYLPSEQPRAGACPVCSTNMYE